MDRTEAENYQLEDFITDESFINYHFKLDQKDQAYWELWLNNHPVNNILAVNAGEILDMLSLRLPENEFREELGKMAAEIQDSKSKPVQKSRPFFVYPMPVLPLQRARPGDSPENYSLSQLYSYLPQGISYFSILITKQRNYR